MNRGLRGLRQVTAALAVVAGAAFAQAQEVRPELPPLPRFGAPAFEARSTSPTSRCDQLAARHDDPGMASTGVNFGEMQVDAAVSACMEAAALAPNGARYHYQLGRALLAKGDDDAAFRAFTRAGDLRNVHAMIALASMHRFGRGAPHNLEAAFGMMTRAAATGHPAALAALATHHRFAFGTPYDPARWVELLRQAAEAGSVTALRHLGLAFSEGFGVEKNADIAEDLFLSVIEHEQPRAAAGIAEAMWVMGWAHERGAGVPKDLAAALDWYRKGEAIGDADAIFSLGWMYDTGVGVAADKTAACDRYARLEREGFGWTLNALSWCFQSGEGRPQDLARARQLYERGMAAGDAVAARNLARLYDEGRGVAADPRRARALFRVSAERGHPQGMLEYGFSLRAERPAEACDWYERAAALGLARAMNNLAVCYSADNVGRKTDFKRVLDWYERAAALGDGLALRNLGDLHLNGVGGIAKNADKATAYYKRGADAGDVGAMVEYGMMVTRGIGTRTDLASGCDWFEKAARAGDSRGMNNIGACFANGEGRTVDVPTGVGWYEKAVSSGDGLAMVNLGDLLSNGRGVTRDLKRALDLFKRAADSGQAAGAVEYAAALYHGNGIARDLVGACSWYEKAAGQNNAAGYNGLGVCFENGIGRKRDLKAATGLFVKAADAGSLTALRNLVRYADRGIGGPRSPDTAADWMRKAFDRGHDSLLNDVISYPSSWSLETRRALQRGLRKDGLYEGPVDGYFSARLDSSLWSKLGGGAAQQRLEQEFAWAPVEGTSRGLLVRVCKANEPSAKGERRPLVVVNHGLTTDEPERRDMRPLSCGGIAAFFVQRGYTVAIPLRRGYGETGGRFTEGGTRICATSPDFVAPGLTIASDIQATIAHMRGRTDIAETGTIVMGHSGGGWGALALASRNTPGIDGYVNISGVHGSNRNRPDGVCGPDPITKSTRAFGKTARAPTLWIYAENDSHAGPRLVRRMFEGFTREGGSGVLHLLPPFDSDGHNIFDDEAFEVWSPVVEGWLQKIRKK